ncbi:MAG: hypothetical protein P4L35_15910 [Ignavibacteriaceae bacterium]|nr:hypothetical protein [Ignavibacteriaceae bacterium]
MKPVTLIKNNLKNIFGWRTKRKIVVFSIDDYGNVRIASKTARDSMQKAGLNVTKNRFDQFDALEDADDLTGLYDTLISVKDKNGNNPVFTAFTVPANIDFEKMHDTHYTDYYYELLPDTYNKLTGYNNVFDLWKDGIHKKLIYPQFHGREHLNIKVLMEGLHEFDKEIIVSLNNMSLGAISKKKYSTISYNAAFDFNDFSENKYLMEIIKDGLKVFEKVFGFRANNFNAPGACSHHCLEQTLKDGGIQYIDTPIIKNEHQGNGKFKKIYNALGKKNEYDQIYLIRNCVFEPGADRSRDWVDYCLKQIETSFRWNKPANISSHRVNFSGHIEPANREKGLNILGRLLKEIIKKWPDVEFMTSNELGDLIASTSEN